MKLYLVRHGESECNVQRRLYGRTDCSLTEKGCRQAREVGEKLRDEKIDLCISSPLIRAAETARLVLAGRNVRIELDDDLMEQHMDEYEVSLSDEEKNAIKEAASEFDSANGLSEKEKVSGSTDNVERVLELLTIQKKVQDAIEAGADTEVSDEEAAQKSMQYVVFPFTSTDEEAAQKSMQYVVFPFTTTDEEGNSVDLTDEEKAELKTTAESFAAGAAGAADFAAYAAQQGQTSQDATFDGETTTLPTQLVEAADALGEGETTGLVEGDNGYYVARVTSLLDREATDAKKQEIVSQRQQELLDDTIDGWREDADIEVHEKVWDKVDFTTLTVTMKQDEADPYTDEVQTDDQAEDAGE